MLHISLLGERVITDGASGIIRAPSSRTVALVAFLVVHAGSPQPRRHIAGLFWPDSTEAQALTNLRRELHHLRRVLGDEPSLVVTPRELCWRDAETCEVDVRTFEIEHDAALAAAATGDSDGALRHATRAISRYRGAFLPGGYEDWLLEARSELERECVALCDLICETRAGKGDLTGAVAIGRRRIELRPLEEVGYRILMRLQADLGDRAAAVSTYQHCVAVLERELSIEPDRATQRTFEWLMAQVPQAAGARRGPGANVPRTLLFLPSMRPAPRIERRAR
jgi:DNA-binding SARP family transcriptional activator